MPVDASTLRFRYPAFAGVDNAPIEYWLGEAARTVTAAYGAEQEAATLALAAHHLAATGVAGIAGGDTGVPAGVTSFRSGSFAVTVDASAAAQSARGGFDASVYGKEFAAIRRRLFGGPRLAAAVRPAYGWWA